MPSSWLQKKRKGELVELAEKAGVPDVDHLLKDEIIAALDTHLSTNETTYAKHPDFTYYYARTGSPVKRERASPAEPGALTVTKPRRRQTKGPLDAESENPTPEKAIVARTPRTVSRAVSRVASQVDIPASPAQLANVADQSFRAAKTRASELWKKSSVEETIEFIRENASSVVTLQALVLLIEAVGLQWNTLVQVHAGDTPEVTGYVPSQRIELPDLRLLLTSDFWAPATLWSLTSLFIPLLVSYFFNLTLRSNTRHKTLNRSYTVDPLTFNIVKALLAYNVYFFPTLDLKAGIPPVTLDYSWGPFSGDTVVTVLDNVPGRFFGLQATAVVGILVSIYDAALKR